MSHIRHRPLYSRADWTEAISIDHACTAALIRRHVRCDLNNRRTVTKTLRKKLHAAIGGGDVDVCGSRRPSRNLGGNRAEISVRIWPGDSRYVCRSLRAKVNAAQCAKRRWLCYL